MAKEKDIEDIEKKEESVDNLLGVFINPRTDFGFKKVFFENEEAVISISNELIYGKNQSKEHIESVTFLPVELLGDTEEDRHVIVDVHCKTNTGEDIIIEMQYAYPMNFMNRLLVYSSHSICRQIPPRRRTKKDGEKAESWHYELNPIYIIVITNFPIFSSKDEKYKGIAIDRLQWMSSVTNKVVSNTVNIIPVDLTRFDKKPEKLETILDYWLYTLKYAETLTERPKEIKGAFFENLYENILRTNKLTPEEMKTYNELVTTFGDLSLFTDRARLDGEEKERAKIVLNIAEKGFSAEYIADLIGLSVKDVRAILQTENSK
jgi:predicted transposase/invertase (TIGR01784 family)